MSDTRVIWLCCRKVDESGGIWTPVAIYDNDAEAMAWQAGVDMSSYGECGRAFAFGTNAGVIDLDVYIKADAVKARAVDVL